VVGTNAQHPVTRFHSAFLLLIFAPIRTARLRCLGDSRQSDGGAYFEHQIRPLRASIRSRVETSSSGITFYCTQADPEAHLARVAKKRVSRPDNFVNAELAIDPVTNRLRENT